mmetsp:Transcript_109814/g.215251  ORF Transcript_109814/g.215251 Transcript_109814/m.215251 type:complete len:407 (+) Transcript_109814:32-1252(+)
MISVRILSIIGIVLSVSGTFLPVIDVGQLRSEPATNEEYCDHIADVANQIYNASVNVGFFYIKNHGVSEELTSRLDNISKHFFALPVEKKKLIDMVLGGKAWRGYFAVGDEMTSGISDQKEGIYFGTELSADKARDRPLHGQNQWPASEKGEQMRDAVLTYMNEMKILGQLLMRAVSCSLNVTDQSFTSQFEAPTELFRIFNYPPHDAKFGEKALGVGEHTDYGYLTLLRQDKNGGLQVKDTRANVWRNAEPISGTFVVNLGDALEHATWGLFKATPHRVQQRIGTQEHRLSMPYFFDPCFDCDMIRAVSEESVRQKLADRLHPPLLFPSPAAAVQISPSAATSSVDVVSAKKDGVGTGSEEVENVGIYTRWDGADPTMFTGTYGSYLLRKVSRAFPALFAQHINQ